MGRERIRCRELSQRLREWLVRDAFPLWSTHGVDRVRGGFHERLNGTQPVEAPRRARVQPRQACAFARARELGWGGDAQACVRHGLDFFLTHYRRPDGLFCTLVAPDGTPVDTAATLYDQAFALLGLAESHRAVTDTVRYDREAHALRGAIDLLLKPQPRDGSMDEVLGYACGLPPDAHRSSNAHMHLLEACLAWREFMPDLQWRAIADEVVSLALEHFIDADTFVLREHFTDDWLPAPGLPGRIVEPGHLFEWAWLLMRWAGDAQRPVRAVALRLLDVAERSGVREGVVINALLDDLSAHDAGARLWSQTERIKATSRAAAMLDSEQHWAAAASAATALLRYLDAPQRGAWLDRMMPDGTFIAEPAPASSFYHIVFAVSELVALTA